MKPDAIKRTIADGVNQKLIAYAGKAANGQYDPFLFEPDSGVDESDIEISDEMVILRANDAILVRAPARLTRIEIRPLQAAVRPDESITFTATRFDQHGRPMDGSPVRWSASGGTIDEQGRFEADDKGDFRIEATCESLTGTAMVRVDEEVIDSLPPQGFGWKGSVPPQKWMNFYTKVLSRFATSPGLKMEVTFRVAPGEAVTEAKIEEAKVALRELGLSEDSRPI